LDDLNLEEVPTRPTWQQCILHGNIVVNTVALPLQHSLDCKVEKTQQRGMAELKLQADAALKNGDLGAALDCYGEALEALQLGADDCRDVTSRIFSNRSMAHLKNGSVSLALSDAEEYIRLAPLWSKGYLRKALALKTAGAGQRADICACLAVNLDKSLQNDQSFRAGFLEEIMGRKFKMVDDAKGLTGILLEFFLFGVQNAVVLLQPGKYLLPSSLVIGGSNLAIVRAANVRLKGLAIPLVGKGLQLENLNISTERNGHVIQIEQGSSADIHGCKFGSNLKAHFPAVVCIGLAVNLFDCEVFGCGADCVLYCEKGASGLVEDCNIHSNAKGAFESREGASVSMRNSRLHDCKQGALVWQGSGAVTLEGNNIYSNVAEGIIVANLGRGTLHLRKNRVYQNGAFDMSFDEGPVTIVLG
jgi:hypothetical protein